MLRHDTLRLSVLLVLVVSACGRGDAGQAAQSAASVALSDSGRAVLAELVQQKAQAEAIARSLSQVVAQIDSEVQSAPAPVTGADQVVTCESDLACSQAQFARLRSQVSFIISQLTRLQARQRSATFAQIGSAGDDSLMRAQLTQLQSTVANFTNVAAQQVAVLDSLRTQVQRLQADSTRLASTKFALDSILAANDSAYFIAAPQAALLKAGAAQQRGGTIFAFGRGKALVPTANPKLADWHPLLKSKTLQIALPRADRWYSIVSPHLYSLVKAEHMKGDQLRGASLIITNPKLFWASSRYLVLQEH